MNATPTSNRSIAFAGAVILIVSFCIYCWALAKAPVRVKAEDRCNQIVAEMVSTGGYMTPQLYGDVRANKPPLFYWISAASCKAAGGFGLAAFRFPAALAALGVLALALAWGRALKSPATGLIAAGLLSVSWLFSIHARQGSFEMLFTFFCNAGVLLCWRAVQKRPWFRGLSVAIVFGLAFLTKATPALVYIPLPAALWVIGMKRWKVLAAPRTILLGCLGLAIGLSWYAALIILHPETRAALRSEFLLPFGVKTATFHSVEHFKGTVFFVRQIWQIAFPMSLFIPLAAYQIWKERAFPADSAKRLLALSFAAPFIVFSILPQKQEHYILPAMLPLAVLCADSIRSLAGNSRWARFHGYAVAIALVAVSCALFFALWIIADWRRPIAAAAQLLVAATGLICLVSSSRGQWVRAGWAAWLGMSFALLLYFTAINPIAAAFGAGKIYNDPNYNALSWKKKFSQYPFLKQFLDVQRGLDHTGP